MNYLLNAIICHKCPYRWQKRKSKVYSFVSLLLLNTLVRRLATMQHAPERNSEKGWCSSWSIPSTDTHFLWFLTSTVRRLAVSPKFSFHCLHDPLAFILLFHSCPPLSSWFYSYFSRVKPSSFTQQFLLLFPEKRSNSRENTVSYHHIIRS